MAQMREDYKDTYRLPEDVIGMINDRLGYAYTDLGVVSQSIIKDLPHESFGISQQLGSYRYGSDPYSTIIEGLVSRCWPMVDEYVGRLITWRGRYTGLSYTSNAFIEYSPNVDVFEFYYKGYVVYNGMLVTTCTKCGETIVKYNLSIYTYPQMVPHSHDKPYKRGEVDIPKGFITDTASAINPLYKPIEERNAYEYRKLREAGIRKEDTDKFREMLNKRIRESSNDLYAPLMDTPVWWQDAGVTTEPQRQAPRNVSNVTGVDKNGTPNNPPQGIVLKGKRNIRLDDDE